MTRAYLERLSGAYEHLLADREAQSVLGRAIRVEAGSNVSRDQAAEAARALIERHCVEAAPLPTPLPPS